MIYAAPFALFVKAKWPEIEAHREAIAALRAEGNPLMIRPSSLTPAQRRMLAVMDRLGRFYCPPYYRPAKMLVQLGLAVAVEESAGVQYLVPTREREEA